MVKCIVTLLLLLIAASNAQWVSGESFKPKPVINLSLNEAWQRQQVLLTVEIPTSDEFARLETEELEVTDFEIIDLSFERIELKGKRSIKIGWILFPLVAGQYDIELPKIIYRPSSGRKIKLKTPLQSLLVKPLPSYIPATMPIGRVILSSSVDKGKFGILHNTETLINWNIELISSEVLPQTIPLILRQVKSSQAVDIFPETSEKKLLKSYSGFQQKNIYKVPIKALKSGVLDLPKLSIQYFDPNDGKLKRANAKARTQIALHLYIQWFLQTLVFLILLFILIKVFQYIQASFLKRRLINLAIYEIKQAKNTYEVRAALHNLSQAKGWGENITLKQWLTKWESDKGQDLVLSCVFEEFQSVQFKENTQINFDEMKVGLLNKLK